MGRLGYLGSTASLQMIKASPSPFCKMCVVCTCRVATVLLMCGFPTSNIDASTALTFKRTSIQVNYTCTFETTVCKHLSIIIPVPHLGSSSACLLLAIRLLKIRASQIFDHCKTTKDFHKVVLLFSFPPCRIIQFHADHCNFPEFPPVR